MIVARRDVLPLIPVKREWELAKMTPDVPTIISSSAAPPIVKPPEYSQMTSCTETNCCSVALTIAVQGKINQLINSINCSTYVK